MKLIFVLLSNSDSDQENGEFIVQQRRWGIWEDLYFDKTEKKLRHDQILGNAGISKAEFSDWHQAKKYALEFRNDTKRTIREVWHV
jgi:hypothetical protein